MRRAVLQHAFLSLFTSPDRASSIVGDLTAESGTHGRLWHARQLIGIAAALWFRSICSAPARSLVLALVALAIWIACYAAFLFVSGLPWYPWHRVGEPEFWIRVAVFHVGANLAAGVLVGSLSFRGANALGPLLGLLLAAVLTQAVVAALLSPWPQAAVVLAMRLLAIVVAFPMLCLLPLVAGGTLIRRVRPVLYARKPSG
jgi:hypothetical protein